MIPNTKFNYTNATYTNLLDYFEPHPITSDDDYWATNAIIDELLGQPELSDDAQVYLHLLSMLIEAYDEQQETIPELRGIESSTLQPFNSSQNGLYHSR